MLRNNMVAGSELFASLQLFAFKYFVRLDIFITAEIFMLWVEQKLLVFEVNKIDTCCF